MKLSNKGLHKFIKEADFIKFPDFLKMATEISKQYGGRDLEAELSLLGSKDPQNPINYPYFKVLVRVINGAIAIDPKFVLIGDEQLSDPTVDIYMNHYAQIRHIIGDSETALNTHNYYHTQVFTGDYKIELYTVPFGKFYKHLFLYYFIDAEGVCPGGFYSFIDSEDNGFTTIGEKLANPMFNPN